MYNIKYRPEIDGLRAISVIAVILYHAEFNLFKGGFLGVDIFFVISGFLITQIILREIKEKKFSFQSFYIRRIRRILPMLYFIVLITIPFSFLTMFTESLEYFGKTILRVNFFISNFWFNNSTNYFNDLSSHSPLLHTWSLAVEEQFYIFYPVLLYFGLKKMRLILIIFITLIIIILSLLYASTINKTSPNLNFFIITSRLFEIGSGVICALVSFKYKITSNTKKVGFWKNVIVFIVFFILLASFFFFDEGYYMPNYYSLIPTLSTAFLLLTLENKNFLLHKTLSSKILVFLGKISYSLYLIHFPFLVYFSEMNLNFKIGSLFFLILISYLCFKYIESPFRDSNKISNKSLLYILLITLTITTFVGIIFRSSNGMENYNLGRFSKNDFTIINSINSAKGSRDYKGMMKDKDCKFWSKNITESLNEKFIACQKKYKKAILVIGDSHAMDLYNVFNIYSENSFVLGVSQVNCRPHSENNKNECHYSKLRDFIKNNEENIKVIFYTQKGSYLLSNQNDIPINHDNLIKTKKYLMSINSEKYDLVWMGPNIEPNIDINQKQQVFEIIKKKDFGKYENKNILLLDNIIRKELKNSKIHFLSKINLINYNAELDWLSVNQLTYSDKDHWSTFGEKYFGKKIFSNEEFLNFLK